MCVCVWTNDFHSYGMGYTECWVLTRTSCCWKINVRSNKNRNMRRGKQQLNEKGSELRRTFNVDCSLLIVRIDTHRCLTCINTSIYFSFVCSASGIFFVVLFSRSSLFCRNVQINTI